MAYLGPLQGSNQGVSWAVFSSGSSTGGKSALKLFQTVGRI